MAKHEDLTGKIFGRLIVLKEAGHPKPGVYLWECECSCSNHTHIIVNGNALRSGNTKSCGCIHTEQLQQRNKQGRKYNKEDKTISINLENKELFRLEMLKQELAKNGITVRL